MRKQSIAKKFVKITLGMLFTLLFHGIYAYGKPTENNPTISILEEQYKKYDNNRLLIYPDDSRVMKILEPAAYSETLSPETKTKLIRAMRFIRQDEYELDNNSFMLWTFWRIACLTNSSGTKSLIPCSLISRYMNFPLRLSQGIYYILATESYDNRDKAIDIYYDILKSVAQFSESWESQSFDPSLCIGNDGINTNGTVNKMNFAGADTLLIFSSNQAELLSALRDASDASPELQYEAQTTQFFIHNISFMPLHIRFSKAVAERAAQAGGNLPDRDQILKECHERFLQDKQKFDTLINEMRQAEYSFSSGKVRTILRDFEMAAERTMNQVENAPLFPESKQPAPNDSLQD